MVERASMYPEKPPHATCSCGLTLCLFKLRVTLDKFFCATSRETHRKAPIFIIAFDANNGPDTETRVADLAPQHGIGVATALYSGTAEGARSGLATRSCRCLFRSAAHPAQELFW